MIQPKLTVATVVLNAADTIALTLESILQQDYPDIELLVFDGGSWDRTPEELALYEDAIDVLHTEEDAGIFHAMNRAAALASGEMILFLNAGDMFYSAEAVSKIMARAQADADLIWGNHIYRSGWTDTFAPSRGFPELMETLRQLGPSETWLSRFPAHQATFTRTALLQSMPYDVSFRVCADHDFVLRAASAGARTQYVDELVSVYTGGGFSLQRYELLRVEWNALHRRYARDPGKVDTSYFGGGSPFARTGSPGAGEAVAGLSAWRPAAVGVGIAHPYRAVAADGARFLVPVDQQTQSLVLRGTNLAGHQVLTLAQGDTVIGRVAVDDGPFRAEFTFDKAITPGAIIDLIPEAFEPLENGLAALALRDFAFIVSGSKNLRRRGETIRFDSAHVDNSREVMGAGWHNAEKQFTWSEGVVSELAIASADAIRKITFAMKPNPVVKGQVCTVEVNGTACYSGPVAIVVADVAEAFKPGGAPNSIVIRPNESAQAGADPRNLGIALVSMKLE